MNRLCGQRAFWCAFVGLALVGTSACDDVSVHRDAGAPDDGGGVNVDAGETPSGASHRSIRVTPAITEWHALRDALGYELTWLERAQGAWHVYQYRTTDTEPRLAWRIETGWSARLVSPGNDKPHGFGIVADGLNPNRFPRWYAVKGEAEPLVYATCEYGQIALAGAVTEESVTLVLPKDCTGRCPSQNNSAYWTLRAVDGGFTADLSCFGESYSEPRALHPDRPFELRNVGFQYLVRELVDGGFLAEVPDGGNPTAWRFLPGEPVLAYAWEEPWTRGPFVPKPPGFLHELRLLDFGSPDAGVYTLPGDARALVVVPEVARTLDDGSLALAGKPRRHWERLDGARVLLVMDPRATEVRRAYWFKVAATYDVIEEAGRVAVVTTSLDGGDVTTTLFLFEPEPLDGGLPSP